MEIAVDVLPGGVVGELDCWRLRTQTLECIEDAEVMRIDYDRVKSLCFANPELRVYLLCLTSARLFQNIAKLETTLEGRNQEIFHLQQEITRKGYARGADRIDDARQEIERSPTSCCQGPTASLPDVHSRTTSRSQNTDGGSGPTIDASNTERRTSYFHSTFITS